MINESIFIQFLQENRKKSNVYLFCDIETATVNKAVGKKYPHLYHSFSFSVAIAFFLKNKDFPDYFICNSFKDFYTLIFEYGSKKATYNMVYHNGNKYDNHFQIFETCRDYPHVKIKNAYIRNAIENNNTVAISSLDEVDKNGTILEKRVKTSNNVEFDIFLNGFCFKSIDNFVKTNASIATIGKKLQDKGLITPDYLKTSFDYTKYDLEEDIALEYIPIYSAEIFNSLDDDQLTYIRNDVIILALCFKHYSTLFFGFDYNEFTFTSNIKKEYSTNDLATFQLLKKVGKKSLAYTNYNFHNLNLFDYFNRFYKGGLNFYNYKYLGEILYNGISFDINSSYPYVMWHFPLPTFLVTYHEQKEPFELRLNLDDEKYVTFFTLPIEEANTLLSQIPSKIFRQMLVKYYSSKDGEVYISSIIIKLIREIFDLDFSLIHVTSFTTFECYYFGARDVLAQNYFIKTQGKQDNKIIMHDPENITLTETPNTQVFSPDEVAGSKVLLNGIYGIPALRANFNLFRRNKKSDIYNILNGFENKERNVVFSACVTAYAFYNLLSPLKHIPTHLIDEYFWYCDTDSLYLDKRAYKYMPSDMFHKMNLGKWDIENTSIEKFYILNHKKYCYLSNSKIKFRCGGIRKNMFNTSMPFETFIKSQFSKGVKLPNTRSIRNEWNTISIYNSFTNLEEGHDYPVSYSLENEQIKEEIIQSLVFRYVNEEESELENELLYVETELGTISARDFIPKKPQGDYSIYYFLLDSNAFKKILEKELK